MKEKNDLPTNNNVSQAFITDICSIIDNGRRTAYESVGNIMIQTYWNVGKRIVEEEQKGNERAEYGKRIIEQLSNELTHRYGKGFSKRYLAYFRKFYLTISDMEILQTRLQNCPIHRQHKTQIISETT